MKKNKSNVQNALHALFEGITDSDWNLISSFFTQKKECNGRHSRAEGLVFRFSDYSIQELVDDFNAQVGNRGFNSARAAHDHALINEFINRGIDVSAIHDGHATSFARKITFESTGPKLVLA